MKNLNSLVKHFIIPGTIKKTLIFRDINTYDDILTNAELMRSSYISETYKETIMTLISNINSKIKSIILFKDEKDKYKASLNKLILNDPNLPISFYTFIKLIRDLNLNKIEINFNSLKLFNNENDYDEITFSNKELLEPSLSKPYIDVILLTTLHHQPNRIYELTSLNDKYVVNTYMENGDFLNPISTLDVEIRKSELDYNAERIINALNVYFTKRDEMTMNETSVIDTIIPSMMVARLENEWIIKITLSFIYQLLNSGYSICFYPDERISFEKDNISLSFKTEASLLLNNRYLLG